MHYYASLQYILLKIIIDMQTKPMADYKWVTRECCGEKVGLIYWIQAKYIEQIRNRTQCNDAKCAIYS